jgi:hypothetical protein
MHGKSMFITVKVDSGLAVPSSTHSSIGLPNAEYKHGSRSPKPPSSTLPQANRADRILALAYPIVEDDKVTSIAGCITDISTFKWAETVQARSAQAAKDAKKLQENFIDVVSHGISTSDRTRRFTDIFDRNAQPTFSNHTVC